MNRVRVIQKIFAICCFAVALSLCCGCTKTNKPKKKQPRIERFDDRGLINYPKS
jgi:hypothetical protein